MKQPFNMILTFFMLCLSMASGKALATDGSEMVRIFAPNTVSSGKEFPVVVRAYTADGSLASDVDGEYVLQMNSAQDVSVPLTFIKGVAYLLTELNGESDYTLSVDGFEGGTTIHVSGTQAEVMHGGAIAASGETWEAGIDHIIPEDVTVPENAELVIEPGANVYLEENCSIIVRGSLVINGTESNPVRVTSRDRDVPWGGIDIINGSADVSYCFFTHGGGDQTKTFGHSQSQPVILAQDSELFLDNCFMIHNAGKGIGGSLSRVTISGSLIARCDTGGECMSSITRISGSHILDIPDNDGSVDDDDNDGFYFTGAMDGSDEASRVENSYIINTEDDGLDHNGALLEISDCWIENCFHEGVAASNKNYATIYNSVIKNCEQGIEAGYGSPAVTVDHCVIVGNDVGLRFGDSYDWGCTGTIHALNTVLYGNDDNIRNYDIKTAGPVENAVSIQSSLTNDPEYDGSPGCITGIPEFDSQYFLLPGSPGIGEGVNGSNMGKIAEEIKPPLVINELLAMNNSLYCDEFGEFDDWIELYNQGSQTLNIAGLYITDDVSEPAKWQIPTDSLSETEIQPGKFLIVWLDDNVEQGPLHIGAKLSGAGEQIAVFAADGNTLVDMVTFGEQQENVSYGRANDGGEEWRVFDIPSPGLSNTFTDNPQIKEYYITCDPDSFALIYENYDEDILISTTLAHASRLWTDTSMRIRGDTSRKYPKKSLRIEFDSKPFSNGRDVLIFNAEYFDQTYVHQYLSSNLFRESGHPCFDAEYARLYLNGEFLGLYLRIENIDEDFLASVDLDPDGELYKAKRDGACLSVFDDIEYHWEKKTNTQSGTMSIEKLIHDLNTVPDEEYYDFAQDVFDYDRMINIIAINMLIINASTYYHNYYMYQDINGSGKWTMFPWDMDKTFSSYSWDYPYHASAWSNYRTPDNPFVGRALTCAPIFQDIKSRIDELHATLFNADHITPVVDSLMVLLEQSVIDDETDNIDSVDKWKELININLTFIDERYALLQEQFSNWPTSFRIDRPDTEFDDHVSLSWGSSTDPNGDPITYSLKYSREINFPEDKTTTFSGLTDTTFTFQSTPADGIYYWSISASDGTNSVEGFDSRNIFVVNRRTILPGMINSDMILSLSGSPYQAPGDIIIQDGAILTIEEGVILQMPAGASIYSYGGINIEGTGDAPVTITSTPGGDRWGAICFINLKEQASISHAVIENASVSIGYAECHAAISVKSSSVELRNITFSNVQSAIIMNGGYVTITNCSFSEDNTGEQILARNGEIVIDDCRFADISGGDIIDFENVSESVISNCILQSSEDDGIDIGNGCHYILIRDVNIYNCADKGISVGQESDVTIERCIISESDDGIAVFEGSSAYIDHVTLYGNDFALELYGSEDQPAGGTAEVLNSILANSGNMAYSSDENSSVTFRYCLSDNMLLPGTGNIQGEPLFLDADNNDFRLFAESPCIDSGDPESAPDPDGSLADIGAYYFNRSSIVINEINYNSSPLLDSGDWVELYNVEPYAVDLSGWVFKDENDDHAYVIPEDVTIAPGGYLVLCNDVAGFREVYPDVTSYIGSIGFGLSGSGELVRLYDSSGVLVDSLTYDDTSPWPEGADGEGATLSLTNPALDNAAAHNWAESAEGGTPGMQNDTFLDVSDREFLVRPFRIGQNYPNPFNTTTALQVTVLERCRIKITIYSILGQKMDTLYDGYLSAGVHDIRFDGDAYSTGIYFYTVAAGKHAQSGSMTLIK